MSRDELISSLRQALSDLERYADEVSYDRFLRERDAQNMVLFAAYRASQDTIDLANLIVSALGLGVPESYRHAFRLLSESKVIDPQLSRELEGWAALRNVIAHIDRKLDLDTIFKAVSEEREPLRRFLKVGSGALAQQ